MEYMIGERVLTPNCMEGVIEDTTSVKGTGYCMVDGSWYREDEVFSVNMLTDC